MAQISDEHLNEFIQAYKEQFGRELTRQEAYDTLTKIVNLYRLANKDIFDLTLPEETKKEDDLNLED